MTTPREQYRNVCESRFNSIDGKLDKIYDKLFEDNGSPCLQTKIDRNSRWIAGVTWAVGCVYIAILSIFAWLFRK